MGDDKMGFNDDDLDRFLVLLEQRELSKLTVKSLIWQFRKRRRQVSIYEKALEIDFLEQLKEQLRLAVDEEDIKKLQGICFSVSHGLIVSINAHKAALEEGRK